jgi:HSP20 family protein
MSMEEFQHLYIRHLQSRVGDIATELTRIRYSSPRAREAWHPPINAYRCHDGIVICAELAGVNRSEISLTVEPRRARLSGKRLPPEPRDPEHPPLQILAMEIDHGAFEREVVLPQAVSPEKARAEQRDGYLWIHLPFAEES